MTHITANLSDFKQRIRNLLDKGISIEDIASRTRTSATTVYRWKRSGLKKVNKGIYEKFCELEEEMDRLKK